MERLRLLLQSLARPHQSVERGADAAPSPLDLPPAFVFLGVASALVEAGFTRAAWLLWGALALLGCTATAIDALAHGLARRCPEPWSQRALIVASTLPALMGLWLALRGEVPVWVPLAVLALGAGVAYAFARLSRRLEHGARVRLSAWLVALSTVTFWVHEATGTLVSVRAGTLGLHVLLFCASWALLLAASGWPALAGRFTAGRWRRFVLALGLVLGVACLELDRRALVGLYPWVHVLLGVLGLPLVARSLAVLVPFARWPRARRGALWLLGVSAIAFVLAAPHVSNAQVRSRLRAGPLGASLLELVPTPSAALGGRSTVAALDHPRHFDVAKLDEPPNILLVTVDALRADALPEMKRTLEFVDDAVVFTRAYAQGTRTAIGVGTLMTGRYSATMDWSLWAYSRGRVVEWTALSRDEQSALGKRAVFTTVPVVPRGELLAERLRAAGYETSAVPFAGKNEFFRGDLVFARGFDRFRDLTTKDWKAPSALQLSALALEELSRFRRTPWFLWVHFFDPHEAKRDRPLYDTYVRGVDRAIHSLLRELGARGAWEKTAFVLTSDHGEAFGEHRHGGHGTSLYEEQVRVPLVFRIPGIEKRELHAPVAAIDVTATLAHMTGAPVHHLDGMSLLAAMRDGVALEPRPIFMELHRYLSSAGHVTHDLKGVVHGTRKLIWDRRRGTLEFFDLATDPGELRDASAERGSDVTALRAELERFIGQAELEHPLPVATSR